MARTLLAVGLLLTVLTAGCGVRPSDVITGRSAVSGSSAGAGLYLISHGELALVLRATKPSPGPSSAAATLTLLAAGPTPSERSAGLSSEVPAATAPATVTPSADEPGITVTMSGAVLPLSTVAANQIICTVVFAVPGEGTTPVTLVGPDGTRPPWTCPLE
ncbi:hypothetical protein OOJ91_06605 [Micromonospora lupini]|uniref:hypothetical protein n=1 Tax=Micromonospora lupini TaxID=285679 RepID=UPI00225C3C8C|nr:hypothetical protein [Micromonospora lupini]MCX5065549.1 hypothetical protein [Micromonospora lupini]